MTPEEEILKLIPPARELVRERLARVDRGENVFGPRCDLECFLKDLDRVAWQVSTGTYEDPPNVRATRSSFVVIDHWSVEDPVALAMITIANLYLKTS